MTNDEARGLGWVLGFVLFLAVAVYLAGCGASVREKTVNTTLVAINEACTSFTAYDVAHQKQILAASPDRTTFDAALTAWKAKRDKVKALCKAAFDADSAAATLDDDRSLSSLRDAGLKLYTAIEELRKL